MTAPEYLPTPQSAIPKALESALCNLQSAIPRTPQSAICNLQSAIKKVRPDDVLGNLPKADRDRILDMLDHRSYRDVLQEINQPAPEGLGLKIQYNSLRKFYLKHLPIRVAEERPESAGDWKLLTEAAARDPIDLQNVIREALEREVYLAFLHSEPTNPRPLKLMDRLLRWRGQDIAKARLAGKSGKSGKSNLNQLFQASLPNTMPTPSAQQNPVNPFPCVPPIPPTAAATPAPAPAILAKLQPVFATAEAQAAAQPAKQPLAHPATFLSAPSEWAVSSVSPSVPQSVHTCNQPVEPEAYGQINATQYTAQPPSHPVELQAASDQPNTAETQPYAPEAPQSAFCNLQSAIPDAPINLEILKKAISMVNAKHGILPNRPSQVF